MTKPARLIITCPLPLLCPCRYTFSTLLSLFNKIVVGKDHGIMGMGAFPGVSSCGRLLPWQPGRHAAIMRLAAHIRCASAARQP
jgi:hypothetical protein